MGLELEFEKSAGSERNGALITCVEAREYGNSNSSNSPVYSFMYELPYGRNFNNPDDWKLSEVAVARIENGDITDYKEIETSSGRRKALKRLGLEKKSIISQFIDQQEEKDIEMPEPFLVDSNKLRTFISYGSGRNFRLYAMNGKNLYWLVDSLEDGFVGLFDILPETDEYKKIMSLKNPRKISRLEARKILAERD